MSERISIYCPECHKPVAVVDGRVADHADGVRRLLVAGREILLAPRCRMAGAEVVTDKEAQ